MLPLISFLWRCMGRSGSDDRCAPAGLFAEAALRTSRLRAPTAQLLFLERLETRIVPSAYTLSTIAFNSSTGVSPLATLVQDSTGDLFGTTQFGGANSSGNVFEVVHGTDTILPLASFGTHDGQYPSGTLTLDNSGDLFGTTEFGGLHGDGTIFELRHGSSTITTLASFKGTNGNDPLGGLIMDSSGDLIGSTEFGGVDDAGAIFEWDSVTRTLTSLASFSFGNGFSPRGGLLMDSKGNIFGTTAEGGSNNDGTIFELPHGTNTIITLDSFSGADGQGPSGVAPSGGLTMDSNGDLFGAAAGGGANKDGTIFELASPYTGPITLLASFNGRNGAAPEGSLVLDSNGDLFGTTALGGDNGFGTVFELPAESGTITTLAFFENAGLSNPAAGLLMDTHGNLFGTGSAIPASVALNGDGCVFELTPVTAAQLMFNQAPSNVQAGKTISPAVTVTVADSAGDVVSSDNSLVTLAVASGPEGATLDGTLTIQAHNGVAAFTDLSLATPGSYTIEASDGSLTAATPAGFTVVSPVSTITFPGTGDFIPTTWPGTITGTAQDIDGLGIASVAVSIFNGTNYWSGSAFTSPIPVFNAATLAGTLWSYPLPAADLVSGTYTVQSRATGVENYVEVPAAGISFLFDATPPMSAVNPLPAVSGVNFTLSWSGQDNGGPGISISFYDVYYSDAGGPFQPLLLHTTQTSVTFAGKAGHRYAFYSVATDNIGNRQPTPTVAQASTAVASLSLSTIIFPSAGFYSDRTWPGSITGVASDPGALGIITSVRVTIYNGSDYWDGAAFDSTTRVLNPATLSGASSSVSWSYRLSAAHLANGTRFTVQSQASDSLGYTEPLGAPVSFVFDSLPPSSNVKGLPPYSGINFTVSWAGHDNPGGSGIAFYDVYYSDNGGPFQLFLTTPQTSATFTGQLAHTYQFASVATDKAGNRQAKPTAAQAATTVALDSTITSPNSPAYGPATWSGVITGLVQDIGLSRLSIGVSIFDGSTYWTGKAFGSPTPIFNPATVSGNLVAPSQVSWLYLSPSNLGIGIYTVESEEMDRGGGVQSPLARQSFTFTISAPASSVNPLPAKGPPTFTVTWSGQDPGGPGISFYDVYYADDGGPFRPFLTSTTATSATFHGQLGQTYAFYSVATDNAGNRQFVNTAQAETTVLGGPVLSSQPVSQPVVVGAKVTLTATATSSPAASVQWQVSTDGGKTFANIAGATAARQFSASSSNAAVNNFIVAKQENPVSSSGSFPMVVADLNGDGIPDLIVANYASDTVSVFLGIGNGTFELVQTAAVGRGPEALAVADLTGDGKPDLIVANYKSNSVSILLGTGTGTFQPQKTLPVGRGPDALTVADVNGDGKPDLVVANYLSDDVSILLGNGNGTFRALKPVPVGSGPQAVAVADLNGDGKPDLIVANYGAYNYTLGYSTSPNVAILLGKGNGTFAAPQTYAVGADPSALAVADLNGDGVPDIIVADYGAGAVGILFGEHGGTFRPQVVLPVGSEPDAIVVADVNGDGRPDILVADNGANDMRTLLNLGDGTFLSQTTIVGAAPDDLALADVNGSGKLALLVANSGESDVSVVLNEPNQVSIPGTSASFSFVAGPGQNGDEYRAIFTNSLGSDVTAAATVTVEELTGTPLTANPTNPLLATAIQLAGGVQTPLTPGNRPGADLGQNVLVAANLGAPASRPEAASITIAPTLEAARALASPRGIADWQRFLLGTLDGETSVASRVGPPGESRATVTLPRMPVDAGGLAPPVWQRFLLGARDALQERLRGSAAPQRTTAPPESVPIEESRGSMPRPDLFDGLTLRLSPAVGDIGERKGRSSWDMSEAALAALLTVHLAAARSSPREKQSSTF